MPTKENHHFFFLREDVGPLTWRLKLGLLVRSGKKGREGEGEKISNYHRKSLRSFVILFIFFDLRYGRVCVRSLSYTRLATRDR